MNQKEIIKKLGEIMREQFVAVDELNKLILNCLTDRNTAETAKRLQILAIWLMVPHILMHDAEEKADNVTVNKDLVFTEMMDNYLNVMSGKLKQMDEEVDFWGKLVSTTRKETKH